MILEISQKERIYTEYYEKVTRYVKGKVSNTNDAEDVVSDVFLKVYAKLDTFDETKASLSTWIYHITQNTVTDYYRSRHVFSEIPEAASEGDGIGDGIEESLINEEALSLLADGLERLEERERNIIILYYYSGIKLKDIAEKMGISYVYVKVLHKKALEKLKDYLN